MKLDLILENTRNKYSLGLLEESEGLSERDLLAGKIMINESTMTIRKMLVEEGTMQAVKGLLQEDFTNHLMNLKNSVMGEDGDDMVNDGMGGQVAAGSIGHSIPYVPTESAPTPSQEIAAAQGANTGINPAQLNRNVYTPGESVPTPAQAIAAAQGANTSVNPAQQGNYSTMDKVQDRVSGAINQGKDAVASLGDKIGGAVDIANDNRGTSAALAGGGAIGALGAHQLAKKLNAGALRRR